MLSTLPCTSAECQHLQASQQFAASTFDEITVFHGKISLPMKWHLQLPEDEESIPPVLEYNNHMTSKHRDM